MTIQVEIHDRYDIEMVIDQHLYLTNNFEALFDNYLRTRFNIGTEDLDKLFKDQLPEKYI